MKIDLNSIKMSGYISGDIRTAAFSDSYLRASFKIACSYPEKGSSHTGFFHVECSGDLAKFSRDKLKSGSLIRVSGSLKHSVWKSRGEVRSLVKIVATEITKQGTQE